MLVKQYSTIPKFSIFMGGINQQLLGFLSKSQEAAWVKNSEVEEEGLPKNRGFNTCSTRIFSGFVVDFANIFRDINMYWVCGFIRKWSLSHLK